jgi:membrane protease YdiL (CAAX protease family)
VTSQVSSVSREQRASQIVLFGLFLIGGLSIYLLGNNWTSMFPTNTSTDYKAILPIIFLMLAVALHWSKPLRPYWPIAFALFIGAFANWLNWTLGNWLKHSLPMAGSTAEELAIDKLSQCIPVVLAILVLTKLIGNDLGSIFLKRGDLRAGLEFGLISFGICAGIFAVIAVVQSNAPASRGLTASGLSLSTIVAALPWILVWAFANSVMEELWFRGIYLKKLIPFLGTLGTIVVTALVFSIPHFGGTYIADTERLIFASIVFVLGFVNARQMLKTDSIWGSVLFHAGYDLIVIIPNIVSSQ